MTVHDTEIDIGVCETRARLHRQVLPTATVFSVGVALVLMLVLWPHAPPAALLPWLLALAVAIVLRLLVGRAQDRDTQAAQRAAVWLRRHRIAFVLHGVAWSSAGSLLLQLPHTQFEPVLLALAAVSAGSLILMAFDWRAALLFVAFTLPMLGWGALSSALISPSTLLVMLALLLTFTGLNALRSQHTLRQGVLLRLKEVQRLHEAERSGERADHANLQLADQHHLLRQLMQTTHQGFWFLDLQGITTDVNPAMAALLGRPREDVLGRSVFDFFAGDDLAIVRAEIEKRSQGRPGGYEVGLVRPDGTRLHCVNHATPLYDTRGGRIGSVGLFTDITVRREAETRLRTYELVVNSITDLVSVTDGNAVYRMVNDAWCRATGIPREQVLGLRSAQALPGGVSPERRQALRAAIESGQPHSARGAGGVAGMADRLLETTFYPYAAESGGERFVAIVTRDITEQDRALRRLRANDAEQRALLDAFPGYISGLDADLNYTYANQRLAKLLGRTPEQVVGRSAVEVLGAERAAAVRPLMLRALAGETVTYETVHHNPVDGSQVDLSVTMATGVQPADGRPIVFGFALDISARVQAERAMTAARDEAERANRAKSQFLAQMSHELRTPLNAILGFGQLLETDTAQPLQGRQPAHVREILRGARHLLALINEILDLGRIEAGKLQLDTEPVPLAPLLDECLALTQPLALEHAVQLLPPEGAVGLAARADRTRMKQVLLNLLANAIKYNRYGGTVTLRCSAAEGRVRLSVQDTGHGLADEDQARLFQPFERLGAVHSGIEGTGIGLALSRRLVESMGGTVGANSKAGVGSVFWIELPQPAPHAAVAQAPAPARSVDSATAPAPSVVQNVLYIEDNAVNVVLMEAMLQQLPGVRMHSALLPQTGLEMAEREPPALVLLDIQLPGMDGFEVLKRLRKMPALRGVPVVAVSANAVPADIDAALAAGFTAYLTKPLELQGLLATVRRLLAAPSVQAP